MKPDISYTPMPYPQPYPVTPMPMRGFGAGPLGMMAHSAMQAMTGGGMPKLLSQVGANPMMGKKGANPMMA